MPSSYTGSYKIHVRATNDNTSNTSMCVAFLRARHRDLGVNMGVVDGLKLYRRLVSGDTWSYDWGVLPQDCPAGLTIDAEFVSDPDAAYYAERTRIYDEAIALRNAGAAGDAQAAIEFCRRERDGENPNWGAAFA